MEKRSDGVAKQLAGATKTALRGFATTLTTAARTWGSHAVRGLVFILLALALALLDLKLLAAWRERGLNVLVSYVPLMLYVYVGLFFDRRVNLGAKLLVLGAIVYGVIRVDLVPDRSVVPGLIDDALLIALAMRCLLAWSTDEIVYAHAAGAVNWRRRALMLSRRRRH